MRGSRVAAAAAVAGAALLSRPAAASWPGPAEESHREGFLAGFSLGPAGFFGSRGLSEVGGVGGSGSLRVGTALGPDSMWVLELDTGGYLLESLSGDVAINYQLSQLALGMQWYEREVLWLKAGAGLATGARRKVGSTSLDRASGVAGVFAAGYDMARWGSLVLDAQVAVHLSIFGQGAVTQGNLGVGLTWY
jgi:hypothetical protein